jgi:acyl carrier protein
MEDLKTKIKIMIVERLFLDVSAGEIGDATPLMETYGVDSVALFELALGLEDEFGVSMDDVDFNIATFRTVNSIAAFVNERLEA